MRWFNFLAPQSSYRLPPSAQVELPSASSKLPIPFEGGPTDAQLEAANEYLLVLTEVFPEHGVDFIRELALRDVIWAEDMSPESILENIANTLTANVTPSSKPHLRSKTLERWQMTRSESYKRAVRQVIEIEFKLLAAETRNKALLRNNFDYYRTKSALTEKASKSYRVAFLSLFSGTSSPLPLLSGNEELDAEMTREDTETQIASDNHYARELNEQSYEAEKSLFECECCFGDYTWEDIAFCPDGHYFCRSCLAKSVEESFHGSSSQLIDLEKASVRCISSTADGGCNSCVSTAHLEHFLPPGIYQRLVDKIAKDNLNILASRTHLLRCPFCSYAIIDEKFSFQLDTTRPLRNTHKFLFTLLIISGYVPALLGANGLISFFFLWVAFWTALPYILAYAPNLILPSSVQYHLEERAKKSRRPVWQRMLPCQNPGCGKKSCVDCGREWIGFHSCMDGFDSEHAFVERKVDEAIKRICPQCNTSFVKDGGCNKMVCPCGYKMCYLCRADLREIGYQHFCAHFRAVPWMKCSECDKCLVYDDPDEEKVIARVKEKARKEWKRRSQGIPVGEDEEADDSFGMRSGEIGLVGFDAWLFELIMWVNGPEK
ncbi:hypothetical protein DL96DRAFT_1523400 [Flagelloscypha sp. PMI_526]|nr:hypothetical protein DL96DRAFT_1523400 [Flagelloscypha sp. PMI_526]